MSVFMSNRQTLSWRGVVCCRSCLVNTHTAEPLPALDTISCLRLLACRSQLLLCSVSLLLQLNEMKRELLDTQQLLQEAGYEKGQMQRRMEELSQRLADKSSSLESSKKVTDMLALSKNLCCLLRIISTRVLYASYPPSVPKRPRC